MNIKKYIGLLLGTVVLATHLCSAMAPARLAPPGTTITWYRKAIGSAIAAIDDMIRVGNLQRAHNRVLEVRDALAEYAAHPKAQTGKHRQIITMLTAQVNDANARVEDAQKRIERRGRGRAEHRAAQEQRLRQLEAQERLRSQAEARRFERERNEAVVESARIRDLGTQLAGRYRDLEAENEALQRRAAALEEAGADADAAESIVRLREQLEAAEENIARYNATLAEIRGQTQALAQELATRTEELREVQGVQANLEEARRRIAELEGELARAEETANRLAERVAEFELEAEQAAGQAAAVGEGGEEEAERPGTPEVSPTSSPPGTPVAGEDPFATVETPVLAAPAAEDLP